MSREGASRAAEAHVIAEALLHPVSVAAILVLIANDHWLKRLYPGLVTGKLSDLAGMVLFPLLLHALLEMAVRAAGVRLDSWSLRARRRLALACAGVTALGFAAVKTLPSAALLYRSGLGSLYCWRALASAGPAPECRARLVRDASDLWALPAVLVAYALLVRAAQLKSSPASKPAQPPSKKLLSG